MHTAKKILMIMGVVAAGGYLFVMGLREFRGSRRLAAEGKATLAEVVDERTRYRSKGRTKYYLTVAFQTEDKQAIRREVQVDYDTFSAGRTGSVTVHYLPGEPTVLQAGDAVETKFGNALLGAFVLGCGLLWLVRFKQPASRAELADVAAGHLKALCETDQKHVKADARQFKQVDIGFYDACQRRSEERGFIWVEDIEEVTSKPNRNFARTFQRVLLSRDGTRIATIAHLKPAWMLRVLGAKEARLFGVDTQFSNDTFVCTDNAEACGVLANAPAINVLHLPSASSTDLVMDAHEKRVMAHSAMYPGAEPVPMNGAEDIRRAMALQQRVKAEFRREHGISKTELARMAGVSGDPAIDNLHADLEKRRDQDRQKAA